MISGRVMAVMIFMAVANLANYLSHLYCMFSNSLIVDQ